MGCWNESIYGGDNALDWKENIYGICNVEEYDSDMKQLPIPKEVFISKMEDILNVVGSEDLEREDSNIGYLVLGALMMYSGVEIDEHTQSRIFKAADEDEWAKDNKVRKIVMNNFKGIIKDYNSENPINIENINVVKETEDTFEDELAGEFKQLFGLMNARLKKLRRGIDEKSGVEEYDEGFADASNEEIDFLNDFKELMSKQEQFGALLERIESGAIPAMGMASSSGSGGSVGSGGFDGGSDINHG